MPGVEDADVVLADWGAVLSSAGAPGRPLAPSAGVLGLVRPLAVLQEDESGVARQVTRDVLFTRRGAVQFAAEQRILLGDGGASYVVRGRAEGVAAGAFDHWVVVVAGAASARVVR